MDALVMKSPVLSPLATPRGVGEHSLAGQLSRCETGWVSTSLNSRRSFVAGRPCPGPGAGEGGGGVSARKRRKAGAAMVVLLASQPGRLRPQRMFVTWRW